MPNLVEKKCVICDLNFSIIYKKRAQLTCSKGCSYKLRFSERKKEFEPIEKICINCNKEFIDKTKKKQSKNCKICHYKKMSLCRRNNGSYIRTKEQNEKLSIILKEKYKNGWNPNTEEHKLKISKISKENWASGKMDKKIKEYCLKKYGVDHWTKSKEAKEKLSKINKGRIFSPEARHNMSIAAQKRIKFKNVYTTGNGGIREDIGFYVRSNWEANFVRILKFNNIQFEYEPKTFQLTETISYTPDFLINGEWYELKGYMNESSILKISLFKQKYPDERLNIIDDLKYIELKLKYKNLILWEGK